MKNLVLGKKVKKKAKYFGRKKFGKINVLEFYPKKHFWAWLNNSPPPSRENMECFFHKGVKHSANSGKSL